MNNIVIFIASIGVMALVRLSVHASISTFGALVGDSCDDSGLTEKDSSLCSKDAKNQQVDKYLKNIINFLLMVVGVLAVVMIIISAFKFATSAGDSAKLTSAKNTLLYSVIGLAVALASFWIVNTVLKEVGVVKTTTNGTTGGKTVNTPR